MLMHTLADVGSLLSGLPANAANPGVHAGLTSQWILPCERCTRLARIGFEPCGDHFKYNATDLQLPVFNEVDLG